VVFYLGSAQGFPRKNSYIRYLFFDYLLPSQKHPAQSGKATVCENQARTQFTPSCVLYSKTQQVVSKQVLLFKD